MGWEAPRPDLSKTGPNKGQGAKMGQNGVQKGARPLKIPLFGTTFLCNAQVLSGLQKTMGIFGENDFFKF